MNRTTRLKALMVKLNFHTSLCCLYIGVDRLSTGVERKRVSELFMDSRHIHTDMEARHKPQ